MMFPLVGDRLGWGLVIFLTGYEKASLPVRFHVVPQSSNAYDPAALIKEIRLSVGLN